MRRIVTLCLAAVFSFSAHSEKVGQFVDGNELFQWCEAGDNGSDTACRSYVMGFHDAIASLPGPLGKIIFCLPDGVSAPQLQKIVVKYGNDNPEDLHHGAADLVLGSLSRAFPCGVKTGD